MALKWADNSLSLYLRFSAKDTRTDLQKGKTDGRKNQPPSEVADFSAYELQLIGHGNGDLARFARHRSEELTRLSQELARQEHERDEGFKAKRDGLQREKDAAIENLRTTHGPMSSLITGLSDKLAEKRTVLQHIELELNRPLRVHFQRTYPLFLILLSLAEVPINKLAFEFFFQEAPIIALGIALMVGVLLISLAHICGIWLRQASHYHTTTGRVLAYVATAAVVVLVGFLIYFIAALRQQFIDFIETEQNFNLSEFLKSGGLSDVATNVGQVHLGTASLTLLFINVAIFGFGMILSFLRHDPHPDYEKAVKEKEQVEKKLQRAKEDFDKRSATIQKSFDTKITYLDKVIDQLESQVADLRGRMEDVEESATEAVKLVHQVIQQRILAYQAGNTEVRTPPPPKYFGEATIKQLDGRIGLP